MCHEGSIGRCLRSKQVKQTADMSCYLLQDQLLNGLNACLANLLKQCGWPPPLANDPNARPNPNKRPRPASASAEGFIDLPSPEGRSDMPLEDLQAPGAEGQGQWSGFDGAGPAVSSAPHFCLVVGAGKEGGGIEGGGGRSGKGPAHALLNGLYAVLHNRKTELWSAYCLHLLIQLSNHFWSIT